MADFPNIRLIPGEASCYAKYRKMSRTDRIATEFEWVYDLAMFTRVNGSLNCNGFLASEVNLFYWAQSGMIEEDVCTVHLRLVSALLPLG